jgi:hypothetical protein
MPTITFSAKKGEGDAFLHCTVTGDKTWICHYKPGRKCYSMEGKHLTSPGKEKSKSQPTKENKMMLTRFRDFHSPILNH